MKTPYQQITDAIIELNGYMLREAKLRDSGPSARLEIWTVRGQAIIIEVWTEDENYCLFAPPTTTNKIADDIQYLKAL